MWKCYFKNLKNGETFTKIYDSQYEMEQVLKKVKYSKKIKLIGRTKVWA